MKDLYYFSPDEDYSSVGTGEVETSGADLSGANVEDINNGTPDTVADNEPAPAKPEVDMNSIYANARRRAEEEANKKINAMFTERFGNLKNPRTGASISSYQDYLDALDAQEQMRREAEAREKGIDADFLNELINNNPAVKKANAVIKQENERIAAEQIQKDIAEIASFDDSVKSINDIPNEVVQSALTKKISLVEAYKIANFGKWSQKQAESARQAAINQVKGKDHLKPVDGVAVDDNMVEIPTSQRRIWEEMFPDKTWAERTKLYNKQI